MYPFLVSFGPYLFLLAVIFALLGASMIIQEVRIIREVKKKRNPWVLEMGCVLAILLVPCVALGIYAFSVATDVRLEARAMVAKDPQSAITLLEEYDQRWMLRTLADEFVQEEQYDLARKAFAAQNGGVVSEHHEAFIKREMARRFYKQERYQEACDILFKDEKQ